MAASAAQIARLRLMIAEPTTAVYSDAALAAYIEEHQIRDQYGEPPLTTLGLENEAYTATYDLNAAAADVWDEKAAALAVAYDVSADGAGMSRSQLYRQAQGRAAHYRSRSAVKSAPMLSRRDERVRHGVRYGGLYDDLYGDEVYDGLAGDEL